MGMPVRRKLAIASWSSPREGNIYGKLTLDCTEVLRYVAHLRETTGERVSISHVIGRAVALALAEVPSLNGRIVFDVFKPYPTVAITYLVALEGGKNLAKVKIDDADKKSVLDITRELRGAAEKVRSGKDDSFNKSMAPLKLMPVWLIRPILRISGWLASALGVSIPALGVEKFAFGGAILTNVGVFGLDEGFAPPTPFARVPIYVLLGAVRDRPWVHEGQLEVRPQITVTATIDHRFIDGAQGAVLARTMREVFADPWALDGLERPAE